MKCSDARKELSALACGEVEDVADLEAHIAGCDECRRELEMLRALQSKVRAYLHQPVEFPDMAESVMALLPARPSKSPRVWRWAWTAACLAVLICAGLYIRTVIEVPVKEAIVHRPPEPKPIIVPKPAVKKTTPSPSLAVVPKPERLEKQPARRPAVRPKADSHPAEDDIARVQAPPQIKIQIGRPEVTLRGRERLVSQTTTIHIGGRTFTRRDETRSISPPPIPDAPFIDRPELKIVLEPRPPGKRNGS